MVKVGLKYQGYTNPLGSAMTRFITFAVDVARITEVGKCDRYAKKTLSQRTGISGICIRQSGGARL